MDIDRFCELWSSKLSQLEEVDNSGFVVQDAEDLTFGVEMLIKEYERSAACASDGTQVQVVTASLLRELFSYDNYILVMIVLNNRHVIDRARAFNLWHAIDLILPVTLYEELLMAENRAFVSCASVKQKESDWKVDLKVQGSQVIDLQYAEAHDRQYDDYDDGFGY